MELKESISEVVRKSSLDYIGIAPIERYKNAPDGHKPTDLLPGARSVISIGIKGIRGSLLMQKRALADRNLRHISLCYRWGSYGLLNRHFLDPTALKIARLLEAKGYIGVPQVSSGVDNTAEMHISAGALSQKHAAVAAGIGEFGWHTLCVTPDAGPRVRFTSIITTAELEPDPMYTGPRLCNLERCIELGKGLPICMKVCPVRSFKPDKVRRVIIGEKEYEYGYSNYYNCAIVGSGLRKDYLGLVDIETGEEDKTGNANFSRLVQEVENRQVAYQIAESWVFGRAHYCGNCIISCPIGMSS